MFRCCGEQNKKKEEDEEEEAGVLSFLQSLVSQLRHIVNIAAGD